MRRVKQMGRKEAKKIGGKWLPCFAIFNDEKGNPAEVKIFPASSYTPDLDLYLDYMLQVHITDKYGLSFDINPMSLSQAKKILALHEKIRLDIEQENIADIKALIHFLKESGFEEVEFIFAGYRCEKIHAGLNRYIFKDELGYAVAHIWAENETQALENVEKRNLSYNSYELNNG